MSSWDDYIKLLFSKSAFITRAAIIGPDGSVWARSKGNNEFRATEKELKKFAALFNDINSVPATGADLEEVHYIVPLVDDKLIFGRKQATGFFAAKANQAIIIGMFEGDPVKTTSARDAVEKLTQYLATAGY